MQIHELNAFLGALNAGTFLAVDDGDDTGRLSIEALLRTVNERIDNIITSPAPTEQEIIDARRGWNEVVYGSLGASIRSQVKQILAQFYKFNTYDLLAVYGTPISRTRNGVTFTWDDAGQVCEVSGEAVGGDAYASIYTQTGAWSGIFEHGVVYTIGYETTDPNVKLRIAVWEGVETTPDYYYFDEDGHFGIPPEAAKISIDLYVASGDTVSAVVKNVYMLRTYTAKEVTATIRDAMIGADRHMYNSLGDAIREQLNGKVDKVTGKVLSSNDFTDALKTKLEGIEAGAEVNAIEAIKLDGTELTPDGNRAVDIPVDDTLTEADTPAEAKAVGEELEKKANSDGYYETLTSGQTEQIIATEAITDTEPYIYRKTGGPNDVGDRVYDTLVGGSVVWNQLFSREKATTFNSNYVSYTNGVYTVSFAEGSTMSSNVLVIPIENFNSEHVYYTFFKIIDDTNYGEMRFKFPNGSGNTTSKATLEEISSRGGMVRKGGTYTMFNISKTAVYTTQQSISFRILCFDLTALLTPAVADHIYTLEQANAGSGVAYFKKYFPEEYYEFCEPHFEHVQTSEKVTVGFNQWDEETELGYIGVNGDSIIKVAGQNTLIAKHLTPVFGGSVYHFNTAGKGAYVVACKNADGTGRPTVLANIDGRDFDVTIPNGYNFIRFHLKSGYGTTYKHNVCLNLHGDRDGEYEAYKKRTYPLDSSLTLRGIPKLDSANRPYFDGDVMRHDGSGEYRYGEMTLDGVTSGKKFTGIWTDANNPNGNVFYFVGPSNRNTADFMSDKFVYSSANKSTMPLYSFPGNSGTVMTWSFCLPSTVTTVAEANTWLQSNPITIVYGLDTPEPFTAEPYQYPMVVDPLGTEEFIDYGVEQGTRDVAIPVGHKSEYPPDLRGKLQHLPGLSSSGDGRYVVVQTGNQMTLSPDTSLGLIAALEARVAALEGGNG